MTALATATTRAAVKAAVRIRAAVLGFAAMIAEARIHKARLEAEMHLNRFRLRTKTDDDLPVIL